MKDGEGGLCKFCGSKLWRCQVRAMLYHSPFWRLMRLLPYRQEPPSGA